MQRKVAFIGTAGFVAGWDPSQNRAEGVSFDRETRSEPSQAPLFTLTAGGIDSAGLRSADILEMEAGIILHLNWITRGAVPQNTTSILELFRAVSPSGNGKRLFAVAMQKLYEDGTLEILKPDRVRLKDGVETVIESEAPKENRQQRRARERAEKKKRK